MDSSLTSYYELLSYFLSTDEDSTNSNIYLNQLKTEFPKSDYSIYFEPEGVDDLINNQHNKNYEIAQNMWEVDPLKSINSMKKIIRDSKDFQTTAKATFSIAYIYENSVLEIDSAKKYYSLLLDSYPTSEQSAEGVKRLDFLNYITKEDSTNINKEVSD